VELQLDRVRDGRLLDREGVPRARLLGGARLVADAASGVQCLDFRGAAEKGVAEFAPSFAAEKQGTLRLRCLPRTVGGIIVGKYGAINIEFVKGSRQVRFGLKLKDSGWTHCTSARNSVSAGQWVEIEASWGASGMVLSVNGKVADRAALPAEFDWFIPDRPFLLGSYDWPGGYDIWFLDGLVADLAYRPEQEPYAGDAPVSDEPADVLELKLVDTPKPDYDATPPERVAGRVVLDLNRDGVADETEPGVAGVSVSDGAGVVKTDAQGCYSLAVSPEAVFVFITRPSGYDVSGFWYRPVAETVDFALTQASSPEDEYTFIVVTDTHVSGDRRSLEGLTRFVREVNSLEPPPRFVFNSGDLVNLDKQLKASPATGHTFFRNYTGIMNHLRMPYYNVAGDHTDSSYRLAQFPPGDPRAGKALYWDYLGPHLFSFEYGRLHFVSLDVVYHLDKIRHRMTPAHRAWLAQDLAARSPGTVVLTASENPMDEAVDGFVDLARQQDICLQLVGDTHIVSYRETPVPSRAHGALSGTWWNGPCADLSPQGYMIYHVRGTDLNCFYKGLGRRVSVRAPAYGDAVTGDVVVRAFLMQRQAGEGLQISVNGSEWEDMSERGQRVYRTEFSFDLNTGSFADGTMQLRVRCGPGGEVVEQVVVADNGKGERVQSGGATIEFDIGTVIAAPYVPTAPVQVLVNDRPVGTLAAGARGRQSFTISADFLRRVSILSFAFEKPDERISITEPQLMVDGRAIRDPRAAAVHTVRANHWSADIVARAGFVLGEDVPETSFALRQSRFVFVMP
jgi:hypothetical protein